MPSEQDIDNQRRRLEAHRESVQILLAQIAQHGEASAPMEKIRSLREARAGIDRCKQTLRDWDVAIDDHPDDVGLDGPPPAEVSSTNNQTWTTEQGQLRLGPHNGLQPLAPLPEGAHIHIGVTHLIVYTGPPEPTDAAGRLALEQAYRSELALRYAEWRRRYVPLPLHASQIRAAHGYEREHQFFEVLSGRAEERRSFSFTDLREGLRECGDLLLLGPPGGGKTTALWRLALDLAEDGLFRDAGAPLPVFVRLGGLQEGQTLLARLQEDLETAAVDDPQGRMRQLPAHKALAAQIPHLLEQGRLVLLWDGLNETPQRMFAQTARQLAALRLQHTSAPGQACTQHLITCRADDYERLVAECRGESPLPLAQATLQGLDWEAIQQIALARLGPERGTALLRALEAPDRRTLAGIARTPLLLTMLCTVYETHGALPGTRGRLLDRFVQERMRWEGQRAPDAPLDIKLQTKALARLAYAMTESQGRGTSVAWTWARKRLAQMGSRVRPEELLARARDSDLLEVLAQGAQVRFSHQLIQEYFAALALRDRLRRFTQMRKVSSLLGWWQARRYAAPLRRTGWEETLLLLAGLDGDGSVARRLVHTFLAQPLEAARLLLASGDQPDPALLDEVCSTAMEQIRDPQQPLAARLAAGEALGLVGDPRLLDLCAGDAPMGGYWCPIAAGPFWFGDDDEGPLEQTEQPYPFQIARFPVTNAEYKRFIDAGGYDPDQPWWSAEGRKWLLPGGHHHALGKSGQPITQPRLRNIGMYNQPSQPVVGVSWYESAAFCGWLTIQGHSHGWLPPDTIIRLPTWREWQRAARHTDRRRYPWGDAASDPERANYKETKIRIPSPVGCFPAGQAACGALDMAGNLWEWTATSWEQPDGCRPLADVEQSQSLILAGESFLASSERLCCGARGWYYPCDGDRDLGFRVFCSPRSLV